MKPTEAETNRYIRECVDYIRERRKQDREFAKGADDYKILKGKLDRAERKLHEMLDELAGITIQMQLHNRWHAYHEALRYIINARKTAGGALGPLADASLAIRRDPATRAMWEQKTAINQAHAFLEPPGKPNRGTRALARRIMDAAGIAHPSKESMTKWLREIRADWDAGERRIMEMMKNP